MFLDYCDNFKNEPEGRKPLMQGECHFMLAYYYSELKSGSTTSTAPT